ncbi:DUF5708 family protein [Thermocrispum municipale]|uniref:DUF5708 family protein n=1 Tax=Thermocrispum municipale TaxID=37926 RepID=UPI00040E3AAD|nr:DUF5708 family protein [Thermocrispum municipale]
MRKNDILSFGIGIAMVAIGVALWLTTGDVETPVVSLDKVGIVVAVLGVVELVVTTVKVINPATRHRDEPL